MHWWNYLIIFGLFVLGCFGVWWNSRIQKAELRTTEANSLYEGFEAGYRNASPYAPEALVEKEYERWFNTRQS